MHFFLTTFWKRFLGRSFVYSAFALLLAGCATKKSQPIPSPAASLVWPAPPEAPRIVYLKSVRQPGDVGAKISGFNRFANWITGAEKGREQLLKPFGVALDEADNLCLTDTGANAVCFFDVAKKKWMRWDRIEKRRFVSPVAVAKRNGIFFIADSGLSAIVAFDENGKFVFQTTNHLERPSGLVISGEQLFVADSQRHRIVVFDLRGKFLSEFGQRGTKPGEFNFPTHISADTEGNLFVTDSMNSRVQMLDRDGNFKSEIGSIGNATGHFSRPKGVASDSFGHVYVIDALFDNIQVFDRDGKFLLNWGASGANPGEFWLPNGIAISRNNEIYVADSYNRRIQIFKYVGGQ
jgi:sugar lactone lactonase YvrE